ncbi:hypothetical protein ACFLZX_01635 [Nanoarchaeota archaeon]
MNKKGSFMYYVMIIIFFIILLITLLLFVTNVGDLLRSHENEIICNNEVNTIALSHIRGLPTPRFIDCPIQDVVISADENPKKELSDLMMRAWDTFERGELQLFEHKTLIDKHCVIMHKIEFEEGVKDIPAMELARYQSDTMVKDRKTGESMPIRDYLAGVNTNPELFEDYQVEISNQDPIKTDKHYATVFTYTKKGYMVDWMKSSTFAALGAGAGIGGGTVTVVALGGSIVSIGGLFVVASTTAVLAGGGAIYGYETANDKAADWDAAIFLIPYDVADLNKIGCTHFPAKQEKDL